MLYFLFMLCSLAISQNLFAATKALPPQSKLVFPGSSAMNNPNQQKRFAADTQFNRSQSNNINGPSSLKNASNPGVFSNPSANQPNFQGNQPQGIATSLQTKPTPSQLSNIGRLPAMRIQQFATQPAPTTIEASPVATTEPVLASRKSVKDLIKKAERDVQEQCAKPDDGTCAKFCAAIYAKEANLVEREKKVTACKEECTPAQRCKINPLAGPEDDVLPGNKELFAQTRDQLAAAVAEARDPEGKRTGRRMIPWKDIQAPSFKRLMDGIGEGIPQEEAAYKEYAVNQAIKEQHDEANAEALAKALEATAPTSATTR